GQPIRRTGLDVTDFVIVLVDEKESGFRPSAINPEISHLSRPAGRAARAPQFVLQVGNFLFGLIDFLSCLVELLLSVGDFRAEPVFASVNVALAQKLRVEILEPQIQKLSLLFRFLHLITGFLKLRSPIFFVPSLVVGWSRRRGRCDSRCSRAARRGGCCRRASGNHDRAMNSLLALAFFSCHVSKRLCRAIQRERHEKKTKYCALGPHFTNAVIAFGVVSNCSTGLSL